MVFEFDDVALPCVGPTMRLIGSSKAVETELQHVEPIIQRAEQVIGSKTAFSQKGFTGQTLELGTQTLSNVQLIEDMAKEARERY